MNFLILKKWHKLFKNAKFWYTITENKSGNTFASNSNYCTWHFKYNNKIANCKWRSGIINSTRSNFEFDIQNKGGRAADSRDAHYNISVRWKSIIWYLKSSYESQHGVNAMSEFIGKTWRYWRKGIPEQVNPKSWLISIWSCQAKNQNSTIASRIARNSNFCDSWRRCSILLFSGHNWWWLQVIFGTILI